MSRADDFERQGFLVLPDFVPAAECEALKARAEELVAGFHPESISIFTTHEQTRTSDEYFLSSGDKIRFFFEEGAFRPDGSLRQAKELSINKIGHALHDRDPLFDRFSRTPALAALASELGLRQPLLLQSMYIFKQPHIRGAVASQLDAMPHVMLGGLVHAQALDLARRLSCALPGGLEIPLSCDIIVASREAKLGIPEVGVGLFGGAGALLRLPRRVGLGQAF